MITPLLLGLSSISRNLYAFYAVHRASKLGGRIEISEKGITIHYPKPKSKQQSDQNN